MGRASDTAGRRSTERWREESVVHGPVMLGRAGGAGALQGEAIGLCRRIQKHLGSRKGVVYSRSRARCEGLASEIRCACYHAGAVNN